jgi:hypothetical protein
MMYLYIFVQFWPQKNCKRLSTPVRNKLEFGHLIFSQNVKSQKFKSQILHVPILDTNRKEKNSYTVFNWKS